MKIIALLPVRNESAVLPTFMHSICNTCDGLIVVDDESTDDSIEIIQSYASQIEIKVISKKDLDQSRLRDGSDWSVDRIRQLLLEEGRKAGGTHFVCLDADECFTAQFIPIARKIIGKLEPGQKIQMQWLAMWKSIDHYRDDTSVWSNNFKDFIFCDDGEISFAKDTYFCDPRTPGPNTEEVTLKLNNKYGAVMHFQFSFWREFQIKQCWYRCRELVHGKQPGAINGKFAITLDDPNAVVSACPATWLPPVLPELSYHNDVPWQLEEIKKLFEEHGHEKFKSLNIWHVPEIRELTK